MAGEREGNYDEADAAIGASQKRGQVADANRLERRQPREEDRLRDHRQQGKDARGRKRETPGGEPTDEGAQRDPQHGGKRDAGSR